ncbi:indolepyruvate ferredoxin oxidoreductase beta subunit [Caminicella sporogenes DSM 14501]|uniref:Indolepyruvate ferredoxin oxidoreductase beta subunit n=1 Tax=Caminicella sporogenes DSM 14501 TaxID=1121266 RepID=A0A1M6R1J7_9FIRM|nr:indolepyruvate oxidoreductase subunit beta [Caminicella sporogenes]RKD27280.1 indolepyruvate oxidoreductase subunit beta [Caminicella sporogenes]SHK26324.1 indolepyruvate ferredoxin oxidoreductase beta subunit [Caminicella sporogenes DSM 14501]
MSDVKNILLVGVGGQGIILASKILSTGLMNAGYDVKMSEVHGMAQRGGSVTTQVRFGKKVYSPIIGKGQADILVSFEKMETAKWIEYLNINGKVVINDFEIPSAPILAGKANYPEGIIEELKEKADVTVFKAADIAKELGNIRTMNVVMVGALVKALGLDDIDWEEVIKKTVKEKFIDINIKAFKKGMEQVK